MCPSGIWSPSLSPTLVFFRSLWNSISLVRHQWQNCTDGKTDRWTVVMHFKWPGSFQRRLQRRMCRISVERDRDRRRDKQTERQTCRDRHADTDWAKESQFLSVVGVAWAQPTQAIGLVSWRPSCGAVYICHSCGFRSAAFCFFFSSAAAAEIVFVLLTTICGNCSQRFLATFDCNWVHLSRRISNLQLNFQIKRENFQGSLGENDKCIWKWTNSIQRMKLKTNFKF